MVPLLVSVFSAANWIGSVLAILYVMFYPSDDSGCKRILRIYDIFIQIVLLFIVNIRLRNLRMTIT